MLDDRIWPHPFVILIDPGFVLGIFRIVQPSSSCLPGQFIRYGALAYANPAGDFFLGVPLPYEDMNLVAVARCESFLFCFFIRQSYQKQEQKYQKLS